MSGSPTYDRISAASLERHRQIHFFLERLERAVEAAEAAADDPEPLGRLPAMLDSLRERFEEHNRDEEEGGLLQSVADLVPEAEDEVLALTDQHRELVEALALARSRVAGVGVSEFGGLRDGLRDLVRRLREHERHEESLIERALAADANPPV